MLFFAEFDLQFFKTRSEMLRHLSKCRLQHPPGDEIYRNRTAKGGVSMYEVRPSLHPPSLGKWTCAYLLIPGHPVLRQRVQVRGPSLPFTRPAWAACMCKVLT